MKFGLNTLDQGDVIAALRFKALEDRKAAVAVKPVSDRLHAILLEQAARQERLADRIESDRAAQIAVSEKDRTADIS